MSKIKDLEKEVEDQLSVNKKLGGQVFLPPKGIEGMDTLSSGSLLLNQALSGNPKQGFVYGRITEIFGPEASGKTTLALSVVREAQEAGLIPAFVDMEHALDLKYAAAIGVDKHNVSVSQPSSGEEAVSIAKAMIEAGYRLVVIDSVAAMTPISEMQGEIGDAHMGRQARLMGQALRILSPVVSRKNSILIFVNQIRSNLSPFGQSETTSGGVALKFYASYRVEIRSPRSGKVLQDKTETGIHAKVKVVKNKLFPPYREAALRISYGKGFDPAFDVIEFLFSKKRKQVKIGKRDYTKRGLAIKLAKDAELVKRLRMRLMY